MLVALSWARLNVLPFSGVELRDLRCLFECICLSRQPFTLSGVQVVYYVLFSVTIFAYVRVVSANPGRPCDIQNRLRLIYLIFKPMFARPACASQKDCEKNCWRIGHMPVLCANTGPHVIVCVCACVCELHAIVCVCVRATVRVQMHGSRTCCKWQGHADVSEM